MGEGLKGGAAHYRLSGETWAIILDEYRDGATVPELSERWRVSRHALRKRITVHGATKRDWGDAQAREQAQARERAQAERAAAEAARAEALFAPPDGDEPEAAGDLAEAAMRASARAMRGRMWDEARALAQLAEAYGRMAQRTAQLAARTRDREAVTLEDIPLDLAAALALDLDGCATDLLAIWDEENPHPAKKTYWRIKGQQDGAAMARWVETTQAQGRAERRVAELEARLGLTPGQDDDPPPG